VSVISDRPDNWAVAVSMVRVSLDDRRLLRRLTSSLIGRGEELRSKSALPLSYAKAGSRLAPYTDKRPIWFCGRPGEFADLLDRLARA
jgi:hypothetical protein